MILDGSDIPEIQRSRPERYPDDRYQDTYVKKVAGLVTRLVSRCVLLVGKSCEQRQRIVELVGVR